MFQFCKNVRTDFLGQIFAELFQIKTWSLLWDICLTHSGFQDSFQIRLCSCPKQLKTRAKCNVTMHFKFLIC